MSANEKRDPLRLEGYRVWTKWALPLPPMRAAPFLLLFLSAACGARSELDFNPPDAAAHPDAGAGDAATPSCAPADAAAPPTCSTWQVAGPDLLISEATNGSTSSQTLGSVIPVGCGVLLSWATSMYVDPQTTTLSFTTRGVAFDGTTTGPETTHSSLTVMSQSSGSIDLAAGSAGVGALVMDEFNCRFLPLDFTGAETGAPITQALSQCESLASLGDAGFSYLVADGMEGSTPTTLVTIDGHGGPIATRPLGDAPDNALWGRLVFGDGSFLLNAFRETPPTDVYTGVLQHFDASGNALSMPVAQPPNAAPVMLAATPSGALASWWPTGASAAFVPLDPTGAESGSVSMVPFADAPYGEGLASTPSGDVLVTLLEDAVEMNDTWTIYVQERAPDGTPRSALVALPSPSDATGGFDPGDVTPIVAADGVHALLVYVNDGVFTRPLQCAE
jgi:hypothetical protein